MCRPQRRPKPFRSLRKFRRALEGKCCTLSSSTETKHTILSDMNVSRSIHDTPAKKDLWRLRSCLGARTNWPWCKPCHLHGASERIDDRFSSQTWNCLNVDIQMRRQMWKMSPTFYIFDHMCHQKVQDPSWNTRFYCCCADELTETPHVH